MAISLYDLSVPNYLQVLNSVSSILEKGKAHAQANGAEIVQDIHQHGFRAYDAADPEGHRWTFVQASPLMR